METIFILFFHLKLFRDCVISVFEEISVEKERERDFQKTVKIHFFIFSH